MNRSSWQVNCPVPMDATSDHIKLAHGEGARLTRRLIDERIRSRFDNPQINCLSDAALVIANSRRLAITTDSYVVSPLFFPGGDIGSLAVHGTVNDLAVSGAIPRWITLAMILEEGLPLAVLDHILDSIAVAAEACRVQLVAGDTKVVPRGAADGMFLNTTGIGEYFDPIPSGPQSIVPGDAILVSGPIGRHGIAVLCAREEIAFEPPPKSDSAPLIDVVARLRASAGAGLRTIRDATRGGVSAVLHEWATECGSSFCLSESKIPLSPDVRGAAELLGLDPLHIACEGTLVAVLSPEAAGPAVEALHRHPQTAAAQIIGFAKTRSTTPVTIRRALGREQPLDEPSGAPLPRIC